MSWLGGIFWSGKTGRQTVESCWGCSSCFSKQKGFFNDNKNNRNNIFCLIPPYPPNSPGERSEGCYLVVMFGGLKYCGYFFDAFQQVVKRRVVAGCL